MPARHRISPILYSVWAFLAIAISLAAKGTSPENITRLAVVTLLLIEYLSRRRLIRIFASFSPRQRFLLMTIALASVVEGMHMISRPVFPSLVVTRDTSVRAALAAYVIDLAFTVPAYALIFSTMWRVLSRYRFHLWSVIWVFGVAQTLGDGGLFYFGSAPWMIPLFIYPMTNYTAIHAISFLAVEPDLQAPLPLTPLRAVWSGVSIVTVYLVAGAIICIVGAAFGFEMHGGTG